MTGLNGSDPNDGSLRGDVTVGTDGNGRIVMIEADNTIGRSGGSLIQAKRIDSIVAAHITDADIDLDTLGGDQELVELFVTEGSWSGTLVAGTVTGRIQIEENLFAEIELTSEPDPASVWWIGGDFDENATVLLPAGGLKHQIIVNGNDDGGEWEGVVQVGSGGGAIVLDGSQIADGAYTNTANSLGGGSVGLATFQLHDSSCGPANNGYFFATHLVVNGTQLDCVPNEGVFLRFYGPLALSEHDLHVKVEKYIDTDWFTQSGFESSLQSGSHARRLWVRPDSGGGAWWNDLGEYRITPLSGRLKSSDVIDTPDVANFTYLVTVIDGCELMLLQNFDFNDDQTVCELDFLAWSSDPCDLNGDNVVDCDDISVMLSAVDLYETLTAE